MGIDLTLLLLEGDTHAHSMLLLERDCELWRRIGRLPSSPAPHGMTCFLSVGKDGGHHYGVLGKDPYGSPLRCVTAGELAEVRLPMESSRCNCAAWAWLKKLPPTQRIVLYWC